MIERRETLATGARRHAGCTPKLAERARARIATAPNCFVAWHLHFTGEGLKQSYLEAYKWHGIAQGRGNAAAAANKTEAGKLLTTEEKAAADKAVTAWLAAHPKK